MFRAVFLTFFGKSRVSEEAKHHLHESPAVMTIPLVILAVGSVFVGLLGVPEVLKGSNLFHHFLAPVFGGGHGAAAGGETHAVIEAAGAQVAASAGGDHHALEIGLMIASVAVGLLGIFVAFVLYNKKPEIPGQMPSQIPLPAPETCLSEAK